MQREPAGPQRRLGPKCRCAIHLSARHSGEERHRCATSYGVMQTRREPHAGFEKSKLCLWEKALLQCHGRIKCPFCRWGSRENILLPEHRIYSPASSKKYFRDPAKSADRPPLSGIFGGSPHVTGAIRLAPVFSPPADRADPAFQGMAPWPGPARPVTIQAIFSAQTAEKDWNERGLPMLVRLTRGFTESPVSSRGLFQDHGIRRPLRRLPD